MLYNVVAAYRIIQYFSINLYVDQVNLDIIFFLKEAMLYFSIFCSHMRIL